MSSLIGLVVTFTVLGAIFAFFYFGFRNYASHSTQKLVSPKYLGIYILITLITYNIFFFEPLGGIGPNVFLLGAFLMLPFLVSADKRTPLFYIGLLIASIACISNIIRANQYLLSLNTSIIVLLILSLIVYITVSDARSHVFAFIRGILYSFWGGIYHIKNVFLEFRTKKDKKKSKILPFVKTFVVSFLILFIFVSYLREADMIFASYINWFIDDLAERLIFSAFLAAALAWVFTLSIIPKKEVNNDISFLHFQDFSVTLFLTILLFGFFLGIQWVYLFSGNIDFSSFEFTYSEYVRKGFKELLAVSFFGLLFVALSVIKSDFLTKKQKNILRILNCVFLIELALVLYSAYNRDMLYIDAYGLTRIRVLGLVFLLWLFSIFILLIGNEITRKISQKNILVTIISLGALAFFTVNAVNFDQYIVNYNNTHKDQKDIYYTSLLSADAYAGWGDNIETINNEFKNLQEKESFSDTEKKRLAEIALTIGAMEEKMVSLFEKYANSSLLTQKYKNLNTLPNYLQEKRKWQSWNYTEQKAFDYLMKQNSYLKKIQCLDIEYDKWIFKNYIDLTDILYERTNTFEYPLTTVTYNSGGYINDIERVYVDEFIQYIKDNKLPEYDNYDYNSSKNYKYRKYSADQEERILKLFETTKTYVFEEYENFLDMDEIQKREIVQKVLVRHRKDIKIDSCEF